MTAKILLFGFDSLLSVLALEAAAGPFGAELIPVARADYNKPIGVLAGEDAASGVVQPCTGMPLGGRMLVLCGLGFGLAGLIPAAVMMLPSRATRLLEIFAPRSLFSNLTIRSSTNCMVSSRGAPWRLQRARADSSRARVRTYLISPSVAASNINCCPLRYP